MNSLEEIAQESKNIKICINPNELNYIGDNFQNITKKFYEEHFDVPCIPFIKNVFHARRILDMLQSIDKNDPDYYLFLLDTYDQLNHESILINPFNIPIFPITNDKYFYSYFGAINYPYKENEEITSSMQSRLICAGISLCSTHTFLTPSCYTHEIAHTITPIMTIENEENQELLPIFLEKVIANKLDPYILKKIESLRMIDFSSLVNEINSKSKEYSSNAIYIYSTLKAIHLFDIYQNGNDYLKKEILKDINKIFNGYFTVDELLKKYDITKENSQDLVLIKKHM